MTIHAYTELHNDYPAFVNLSERSNGLFALTVRSRGDSGRNVGVINLDREHLQNLVDDASRNLGQARTFAFDQFVQYGRDHGANIVNGMPWSFQFEGYAVTHETDEHYLICLGALTVHFDKGDLLVIDAEGRIGTCTTLVRPA